MPYVWQNHEEGDFSLGNTELIGEALRGMQGRSSMGAGPARRPSAAATKLSGALAQLASQRFNDHAPLQKTLHSPYKDSTQFGVDCNGTFPPSAWSGTTYPTVTGRTRVYQSFKPLKAIADKSLIITFSNASLGATTVAVDVNTANDLILTTAFAGAYNCFPTAPDQSTGLSGNSLAYNSLGNGISWPTINGGIDLTVGFAIKMTAIYRATPPAGYTSANITTIQVLARLNFLGESLR